MAACPARTEVCEWPENRTHGQGEAQWGGKEASGAFGAGAVYCHILNKGTWHIPADPLQNTQHNLKYFFWSCPDPDLHEKLSWNEKN